MAKGTMLHRSGAYEDAKLRIELGRLHTDVDNGIGRVAFYFFDGRTAESLKALGNVRKDIDRLEAFLKKCLKKG